MACKRLQDPVKGLFGSLSRQHGHALRHARPIQARYLTTESVSPAETLAATHAQAHLPSTNTQPILKDTFSAPPPPASTPRMSYQPQTNPFLTTATCTLHSFPDLEPTRQITYPGSHLLLPLRKDILHRAVIFEGDMTRQGTASTKWRADVHGSNRKVRPQKGTGSARLGNKKSPMLRGGGVAFGPKPRDFSTELPQKIYDLAWRTALSYRFRRGELIVLRYMAEIERSGPGSTRWLDEMLKWHRWERPHGKSLFITMEERPNLFAALKGDKMAKQARALEVADVDVKDLLEGGRLIVERAALDRLFAHHTSDLKNKIKCVV